MKLANIDIDELVHELGTERNPWIKVTREENRQLTEAERLIEGNVDHRSVLLLPT